MKIINIRLKLNLKTKKKKQGRFCIVEKIETLKNKDFKVILTYDPVLCGIVGSFTSIISIHSFWDLQNFQGACFVIQFN